MRIYDTIRIRANPLEKKTKAFKDWKKGKVVEYQVTGVGYLRHFVYAREIEHVGTVRRLKNYYHCFNMNEIVLSKYFDIRLDDYV